MYFNSVHTVSPPCRNSFLPHFSTLRFFLNRPTFWDQAGKFMVFSFLWQARPSMVVRFCSRGQLWNKSGKSTNNATKETTQRRPDGNGARSWEEKSTGKVFQRKVWWFCCCFFGSQLIDFSYSYKLPVKLWRDFWGHLTLQQQSIWAYD